MFHNTKNRYVLEYLNLEDFNWDTISKKEELEKTKNLFIKIEFNEEIEEYPEYIRGIYFKNYGKEIKNLPENLELLCIDNENESQQEIKLFPKNLKILNINGKYNYSLDNLPNNLKSLSLLYIITDYGINNLPLGLECLCIFFSKKNNNFSLDFLPETLKALYISSNDKKLNCDTLPKDLKSLTLNSNINNCNYLPENLEELFYHSYYDEYKIIEDLSKFRKLKKLYTSKDYPINLEQLSDTIETIQGGCIYNFPENKIFKNLKTIYDCSFINSNIHGYNQSSFSYIYSKFEKIYFEIDLDKLFPNLVKINNLSIPPNVRIIKLPSKLEELDIRGYFNMNIEDLPETLKIVNLPITFNLYLPHLKNLKKFTFNNSVVYSDIIY